MAYDTVAQGGVIGDGVTRRGGRSWYALTADYPFGAQLRVAAVAARAAGGEVVGSALHPHEAEDFVLLPREAAASKAAVLGLTNGHIDLVMP
jgi:branched-chain amino acid transport system substrate-binding protein